MRMGPACALPADVGLPWLWLRPFKRLTLEPPRLRVLPVALRARVSVSLLRGGSAGSARAWLRGLAGGGGHAGYLRAVRGGRRRQGRDRGRGPDARHGKEGRAEDREADLPDVLRGAAGDGEVARIAGRHPRRDGGDRDVLDACLLRAHGERLRGGPGL